MSRFIRPGLTRSGLSRLAASSALVAALAAGAFMTEASILPAYGAEEIGRASCRERV